MPYLEELMQRYIKYSITRRILGIFVLISFSIILEIVLYKVYKNYKKEKQKDRWYGLGITFTIIKGIFIIYH